MRRRGAKNEDNDRPPRPPNAFILFRTAYHKANCTGERRQQKSVSREASERWNSMTAIEKAPWKAKAEERSLQHKLLYPDYKYCPKRRKRKVKSSGSRSPSEGPYNEPPRRRRRRRSPSLLPDTTSTISDPVAASTSSAARAPTHPALDAHSDATLGARSRELGFSSSRRGGSWCTRGEFIRARRPGDQVAFSEPRTSRRH
ncbi:hypothetical protein PYCCODRAFT_997074 [Trametes coccinea BRFM310]|uniref:HMG box domain-containing protein n=1 Tax=Trametes coccinea (strain BRFM310) TaxID=1353009 RepID=A0A1Y2IBD2_TRAC3|nr:hypothetical protein PYCCODRAFT_997074 [Trametes coccinea BRFM310]